MTFVFVSNYFNHHQKPFCDAMYAALGAGFTFLETEEMTKERKAMGWGEALPGYVKRLYAPKSSGSDDPEEGSSSGIGSTGIGTASQKQQGSDANEHGSNEYQSADAAQNVSSNANTDDSTSSIPVCSRIDGGSVCFSAQHYVNLIMNADMVLFGDAPEHLITPRLMANRPTLRMSESIYKEGQWKFITPRGLYRKYLDHIRFRGNRVWLLCAGGYVASDFSLIHAYPGKMLKWGYFPETRHYDMEALMGRKPLQTAAAQQAAAQPNAATQQNAATQLTATQSNAVTQPTAALPRILWAGRMIDWKHPEWALEIAKNLTDSGIPYELELIGEGPMRQGLEEYAKAHGLSAVFTPFLSPGEVREHMEQADLYLLLSDKREGWGAVLNEAMNSGCAVIANASAGAVPFLLGPGARSVAPPPTASGQGDAASAEASSAAYGFIFRNGDVATAVSHVKRLLADPELTRRTGLAAYRRITEIWNAEIAAKRLLAVSEAILSDAPLPQYEEGPCSVAENISVGRFAQEVLR